MQTKLIIFSNHVFSDLKKQYAALDSSKESNKTEHLMNRIRGYKAYITKLKNTQK